VSSKVEERHEQLLVFYDVETYPDLVDFQEKHVERLQSRVEYLEAALPTRPLFPPTPRKG